MVNNNILLPAVDGLLLFIVTFKIRRTVKTWERYALDETAATESAKTALDAEYFGAAVLISVKAVA